jgi:hypothetical protein
MPLILAVEPDRRQSAQLAAIVRERVRAELVVADTTEGALDAIGNRVPDLVLVPALLSPQDDEALAAALRVIAAAAHVRTLTIPVLDTAAPQPTPTRGVFGWLRGGKTDAAPAVGCDPATFADQIAAYLEEIAAERADLRIVKLDIDENPQTAARFQVLSIPTMILFKGGEAVHTVIGAYPKKKLEQELEPSLTAA